MWAAHTYTQMLMFIPTPFKTLSHILTAQQLHERQASCYTHELISIVHM